MVKTYKCVVKFGHNGSGKCIEKAVYVRAPNVLEALKIAKKKRGVKKGNLFRSGGSVLEIVEAK